MAEAAGDRLVLMDLAFEAAFLALRSDDHDEVDRVIGDAIAVAQQTGSDYFLAWNLYVEGMSALRRGRLGRARAAGEHGLKPATEIGDALLVAMHEWLVAEVTLAEGSAEQALLRSEHALADCERAGADFILPNLLGTRARAHAGAGALAALQTVDRVGDPWSHGPIALTCARFLTDRGDHASAAKRISEARHSGAVMGSPWIAAVADHTAGILAAARGEWDQAEDFHHAALATAVTKDYALVVVDSLEALAAVAAAGESWEEAARLVGAAARRRDDLGYRHGRVLAERAEAAARQALDGEAYDAASAAGGALDVDAAVAYATRARGERKRPSSGWASLTPTELEVVTLAAQGLSNAEIGKRMFISPLTAKVHLSHIYAKLGIANRVELAAEATRRSG